MTKFYRYKSRHEGLQSPVPIKINVKFLKRSLKTSFTQVQKVSFGGYRMGNDFSRREGEEDRGRISEKSADSVLCVWNGVFVCVSVCVCAFVCVCVRVLESGRVSGGLRSKILQPRHLHQDIQTLYIYFFFHIYTEILDVYIFFYTCIYNYIYMWKTSQQLVAPSVNDPWNLSIRAVNYRILKSA